MIGTPCAPKRLQVATPVTPEFAALGDMYEVSGLIWSAVAPEAMNHYDAENYCQNLGRRSKLPSKKEVEALIDAMSPEGGYNTRLLPGTKDRWFWSSTLFPNNRDSAYIFQAAAGFITNPGDRSISKFGDVSMSVRCVYHLKEETTKSTEGSS